MRRSSLRKFEPHVGTPGQRPRHYKFPAMAVGLGAIFAVAVCQAGTIVDRVAVVVGKHVIKTSDIERDLRVTTFLNNEPVHVTPENKRKSAERLIDQQIIHQEILTSGMRLPGEEQARMLEEQLQANRFGGSAPRLQAALARYGLDELELRGQLLWELAVLRFIDQRFREGVLVTDEELREYYDQHSSELSKQYPQNHSFDALEPKIRESLEGERVDQNFNQWLEQARRRTKIEYKQEAFQ